MKAEVILLPRLRTQREPGELCCAEHGNDGGERQQLQALPRWPALLLGTKHRVRRDGSEHRDAHLFAPRCERERGDGNPIEVRLELVASRKDKQREREDREHGGQQL